MKDFNYNVNSYFADGTEMTLRTNNVRDAIEAFFENVENGVHCNIVNGFTGEVLVLCGNPEAEDFATDEMALMMVGYLAEQAWGDEDEDVPTCQMCGCELDEQGVCKCCGVVDGSAVAIAEEETGSIVDFLEEMVAQGKAVKLGGMPS